MAINKAMRRVLKTLSYGDIEVESSRKLANLKAIDPLKRFYKKVDYKIYNGDYEIPIRLYLPDQVQAVPSALLFLHGGGWVTESIDTYDRVCAGLAKATGQIVASVEYRLAPEHRFPTALMDCYAAAEAIYMNGSILNIPSDRITLIGDSAGGNLAAAVSLMAREKKKFMPKRQILIYPALYNDYSETSPFPSVQENGKDFLLTSLKMCRYLDLYKRDDQDLSNPYLAPLLMEDLSGQPRTLVITAEYDPLRDEGEEYARRLKEAGNEAELHRIKDALHGFFALGIKYYHVQESFDLINQFLKED